MTFPARSISHQSAAIAAPSGSTDASLQAIVDPYLSVILPIYNEGESIGAVVQDVLDTLLAVDLPFEVIAVDDGSSDCTGSTLMEYQRRFPDLVRVARHVENKGNGAAQRTGIRLARGEIVACMDADGQHFAAEILRLLDKVPPYDLVVGARSGQYAGKWYRNLANAFYNRFASWLTQHQILDLTSGFRVYRRQAALHFVSLFPAGFSATTTMTMAFLKAGYSVAFEPIEVRPRSGGKSKINVFKDGRQFFLIILRMVMLYDPLRIFFPVSSGLFLLGLISMAAGIWAAGRPVVPGSSVVLFIAAVLGVLLGLVSSQISNTLVHYHGDEYVHLPEPPEPGRDDP